jgi:hypothetical protein
LQRWIAAWYLALFVSFAIREASRYCPDTGRSGLRFDSGQANQSTAGYDVSGEDPANILDEGGKTSGYEPFPPLFYDGGY